MAVYAREDPEEYEEVDRWEAGVGWIAHPDEGGRRASHAVRTDEGVWLLDPLDAPGVDDLITDLGAVAGVAVLSSYHARDAGAFAERYDVPVHVPGWVDRVEERIDAPIERFDGELGASGLQMLRWEPMPGWQEGFAWRESDRTLYVPDSMAAMPDNAVGDERIGLSLPMRLRPPRAPLEDVEPERVLFGHGEGVDENADAALEDSLDHARRRFPRALIENGWTELKLLLGAFR